MQSIWSSPSAGRLQACLQGSVARLLPHSLPFRAPLPFGHTPDTLRVGWRAFHPELEGGHS